MSKILRRGIQGGFSVLSLLIFWAVFTGWEVYQQNYNNRSQVTPALAILVLVTGIILWKTNVRRFKQEELTGEGEKRTDRVIRYSAFIVFAVQVFIFWNIFFKTGWDVGVIESGAGVLLGKGEGNEWLSEYFSVYSNNILLTWFYCFTLWIGEILGLAGTENIQMVFIVFNSAISCITACLTYYCTKKLCGFRLAVLGYIFCILSICMSPWTSIPYSDPLTVFIPIAVLALYMKVGEDRDKRAAEDGRTYRNVWLWSVIFFLGMLGYHIKPQTVIVLIAIVIISIINYKKKTVRELLVVLAFCLLGVFMGECVHKIAWNEFDKRIPLEEERAFSYYHWMMMGLNDATNGRYNEDDVNYSKSFQTQAEQIEGQKEVIVRRLGEYGAVGYLRFLKNKAAICYSDGTFSWSTGAGNFYETVYEEKIPVLSSLLRDIFYYHGMLYPFLSIIQQLIWISLLLLCIFSGIKKDITNIDAVLYLVFVGAALFELIFEIFPRHLYCNVPCFIVLAMCGFNNIDGLVMSKIKEKKIKKKNFIVINIITILALFLGGGIWIHNMWSGQIVNWVRMRNVDYILLPGQEGKWNLINQIEADNVIIMGRTDSSNYPYGYNVGGIEDQEVGAAVLITPSTSISVFGIVQEDAALEMDFQIHPWVAEASDGVVVSVTVSCEEREETFSYEIFGEERVEVIDLKAYEGERLQIDISVSNKEGCNENCDWLILRAFSVIA